MKVDLNGRVAVVTGSGGAIGREIALKMSENGAYIAVNDINEENGLQVVREIEASGGKAIFVKVDISSSGQMEMMAVKTMEAFGKVDILAYIDSSYITGSVLTVDGGWTCGYTRDW
ncbi:MAG: SDR family NAD(P)-dependent oxidoreductase [Clostridiales bacterium]|nr:SDR family NAD(P)-dependent oxidoreductase [Clostridiales bacterium]